VEEAVLQPFLYQKARRLLPITVKSDSGLAEGELWFVEGDEITFWSVEQLRVGGRYEMRADVKTLGRNVDLAVEVEDCMAGRDAAVLGGYLLRGRFREVVEGDGGRLQRRFWQLNPEHAPPDAGEEPRRPAGVPSAPPRERTPSEPPPRPSAAAPAATSAPGAPPRGARKAVVRKVKPAPPAEERIPPPPMERPQRVIPELAPGDPPSAMIRYLHREVMQADAVLKGDALWLWVARHPLLCEDQPVAVLLQVPAGHILQFRAVVAEVGRGFCVLEARRLHAAVIANLRAALGL